MTGAGHFYGEVFDNHRSGRPESCDRLDFLKPAGTLVVTGQKGNFMAARTQTETEANHTHMLPEASVPILQLSSRTLLVLVPKGFCLLLPAQLPLPPFHPKFTTSLQDLHHRWYCQNRHSGSWGSAAGWTHSGSGASGAPSPRAAHPLLLLQVFPSQNTA